MNNTTLKRYYQNIYKSLPRQLDTLRLIRTRAFQKYWIVQEFYKKAAHIRMWGSH